MIDTVLFDLDGTLLPMDLDEFSKRYFKALAKKMTMLGYDAKAVMKAVLAGTEAMVKNDGRNTNEIVFWDVFCHQLQVDRTTCENDFLNFYQNEFDEIGRGGEQSDSMIKAVQQLYDKGYRLLLTTNPLFPKIAVEKRLRWAGIDPSVFSLVTSYDTCHYAKPNVAYYQEVIALEQLQVEQCMMVGNDSLEDGVVETLGIPLYLVEDYLIHRENTPLQSKWHGSSHDFLKMVTTMPSIKKCCKE